jgi:hypothetical protein
MDAAQLRNRDPFALALIWPLDTGLTDNLEDKKC